MHESPPAPSAIRIPDPPTHVADPSPTAQESRIRAALGLSRGELPPVALSWLCRYYAYLVGRLALPFEAQCADEYLFPGAFSAPVTVVALLDPRETPDHDNSGLVCRALRGQQELKLPLSDVELGDDSPNYRLVEDYWYWFWNWRFDPRI